MEISSSHSASRDTIVNDTSLLDSKKKRGLTIEGYPVEGLSIGGHETCVIFPSLKLAFDIGRCPHRAIAQDFLFISHGHMDHIGGLPFYVATRGLYRMKPPSIFVPSCLKENVERLFEVHRSMDHSLLEHNLITLDAGQEFQLRRDLKVRAFKMCHVIPCQGYVIYSVKQKLKPAYIGLSGNEIKNLKNSGVEWNADDLTFMLECLNAFDHLLLQHPPMDPWLTVNHGVHKITNTVTTPEIAFTGDTTADFIVDDANLDMLRAKILVMECTFVDGSITPEHAREYGHTHLSEIINYAHMFENKAVLLIHFSARYRVEEIEQAVSALPPPLAGRVFSLTEGF